MPVIVLLLIFFVSLNSSSRAQNNNLCIPSSCGKIQNITYPFRLETDPNNCEGGETWHNLSCENNIAILKLNSVNFNVESIDYNERKIRIVDSVVQKNNCATLPRHSFNELNFSGYNYYYPLPPTVITSFRNTFSENSVTLINCENPVNSSLYIDAASCVNHSRREYFYAVVNENVQVSDLPNSCRIELMTMVSSSRNISLRNVSFSEIHDALAFGVELDWFPDPVPGEPRYFWDPIIAILRDIIRGIIRDGYSRRIYGYLLLGVMGALISARFVLGSPFVIYLLIYKWRRRHLSMYNRIEDFLQSYNNLVPIRYSYSEIKKMTKGFTDKIGEGGYGTVYKGKLRSDRLVAIKMLGGSKGNGEDFINEVATIGRIHHVNVVQLIGFCVEGSKRALVYSYMPEGSLDKHIFSKEGIESLSSEKMFEIALGVARGIEYLHRGCEIQILHFDIKPHNILLDENFVPKVSDFGLARLCTSDNDTVILTAARGTLGYIAPELFYKNIGGVSYKADVYSFGMLLMEMASRRKNVNSSAENSSQVHFPTYVSNRFNEGNEIDFGVTTDEELKLIKKMMIVALWCIQFKPCDRPSMSKVVEMLEDKIESLQMPPTAFTFYLKDEPIEDLEETSSTAWSSFLTQSKDESSDTYSTLEKNLV